MSTDTTEKGLETLVMRHMTGTDGLSEPDKFSTERRRLSENQGLGS